MQNQTAAADDSRAICLIVEDSQFDQQMMTRVIAKSTGQMRVQVASTLQAARLALAESRVALILLDNNLPDGLGANFALELARDAKLSSIPVILVSDWPSPFMWEKAASAGVTYVLNKTDFNTRYVNAALQKSRKRKTVSI